MRTILAGLMAAGIAAIAAASVPTAAQAERLVYYGDSARVYRVESDHSWRYNRGYRYHRPFVRLRRGYDPYHYRSYRAFGPSYDRPYYPRRYYPHRYWGRDYYRPGLSIELGF